MSEATRRRPDFVLPGFPRCGTTWLYEVLRHHPEIYLPVRKEVDFFRHNFDRGYDWYAAYFQACGAGQLAGDISPLYVEDPATAERIHATLPEARIILSIREHVERVRSTYWHIRRDGKTNDDLIDFLEARRGSSPYLDRHRYAPVIETYTRLYPQDRVMVLLYDEIRATPRAVIERVLGFLGVADEPLPTAMEQTLVQAINPTFIPAKPSLYRAAQKVNHALRGTHLRLLDRPLDVGKRVFFQAVGQRRRQELGPAPGEDRVRDFYAADRDRLERLLNRPPGTLWASGR